MTAQEHLLPRLVIAAPQGRSGKTTISLGICAALRARGNVVQPFKKGPDYIDPSWLSEAAGISCRSLDPFFIPDVVDLRDAFWKGARRADLSLVEGNHGLYDSSLAEENDDGSGSTAAVARSLGAPVLLVVNATRMTRSAAAMVLGYQLFEPETPLRGVILNQVANSRHEARLRQAIESACHIPVMGAVPRSAAVVIPDRHLGLVPRGEDQRALSALDACRIAVERHIDLNAVLQTAASAPPLLIKGDTKDSGEMLHALKPVRIGVFQDRAFSFYYPENLEALEEAGGELVVIDAINDLHLPAIDALYIGGGFPEVFMESISANRTLREEVRDAAEAGLPIYAECGGLMYLARSIRWGARAAEMAGVFPVDIELSDRPQGHGYVQVEVDRNNPFFARGVRLRGHEFHHSHLIVREQPYETAYRLERGKGIGAGRDGLVYKNVLAAYTHLHVGGAPGWANGLVSRGRETARSALL